jgi:hypothetical protein
MKKKLLNVNVLGAIAGVVTLIIVLTSLIYFLYWKPFLGRQGARRDYWERMEEQYPRRSRRHMERMWRKYQGKRFDPEYLERKLDKWREDHGEELSEDFWEWLEKKIEEYLEEEPEPESI